MEEGKRQKQIAGLLNEEMNGIFQRMGLSMIGGGMVSISSVKVTPDLLEARFYLSFFQVQDLPAAMKKIEDRHHEIKKELAAKVRHQLRSRLSPWAMRRVWHLLEKFEALRNAARDALALGACVSSNRHNGCNIAASIAVVWRAPNRHKLVVEVILAAFHN